MSGIYKITGAHPRALRHTRYSTCYVSPSVQCIAFIRDCSRPLNVDAFKRDFLQSAHVLGQRGFFSDKTLAIRVRLSERTSEK